MVCMGRRRGSKAAQARGWYTGAAGPVGATLWLHLQDILYAIFCEEVMVAANPFIEAGFLDQFPWVANGCVGL